MEPDKKADWRKIPADAFAKLNERMIAQGMRLQRLTSGEKKMLKLAAWVLQDFHDNDCCDIDGGDLQNYLDREILEKVAVEKPCRPEGCKCDELDMIFPGECSQYSEGIVEVIYDHTPRKAGP